MFDHFMHVSVPSASPTKCCVLWEQASLRAPFGQPLWLAVSLITWEAGVAEGWNRSEFYQLGSFLPSQGVEQMLSSPGTMKIMHSIQAL